jgi:hypothetical protein
MSLQFDQLNNQLRVNDASNANAPIVLQASGTGAMQAQLATATATGGNARGANAIDWQTSRGVAAQVASGATSTIGGGSSNQASGQLAVVAGGDSNRANALWATVAGGGYNQATAQSATVMGGDDSSATGTASSVLGGSYGTTRGIIGLQASPACNRPISASVGISQSALLILACQTTDATATILRSDTSAAGTTNQIILPNNSAYYFKGRIIAGVTGAGNTAAWTFEGAIKRGAGVGTTAIVGTINTALVAQDAGASTWSFTATADTTNGGLAITVTGQASTTIRWVCKIETTEMTY